MNIKNTILGSINNVNNFLGNFSDSHKNRFKSIAINFLSVETFGELERQARNFITFMLFHHGKTEAVSPILEYLSNFEIYGDYNYQNQRLHYSHQVNVFLLGLYLYHNNSVIKKAINNEMERTTTEKNIPDYGKFRFSGDSKYGEFLYRWKLASLCHDFGNGISLLGDDTQRINESLS
ncbi:MAG: hypothetical protein NTW80_09710, partial [Deltaproteobacteria bacterium]|nr:hypothetical protein [Deltaproteobacteria bacterium]